MAESIRQCAVAGRFYPSEPDQLLADVHSYLSPRQMPSRALGCVVPHAGYVYSGAVAGAVFSRIEVPPRCVVLCPNHTGYGGPLSIVGCGRWSTPLGDVPIDHELAQALKLQCALLEEDSDAHRAEHAIEVELPFLRARQPALSLTPIAVGTGRFAVLAALGEAIAAVIASGKDPVLVVASSDMNHYEDDATTRGKDAMAIERMLALDPRGLFDVVHRQDISMCGYGPAVAMLTAANKLGAKKAELVHYATSGDAFGDRRRGVGYAGIAVI